MSTEKNINYFKQLNAENIWKYSIKKLRPNMSKGHRSTVAQMAERLATDPADPGLSPRSGSYETVFQYIRRIASYIHG